ncbi:F-box protein CPR1 [Bienertia sinuspersici]
MKELKNFRFTLHKDSNTLDWITELEPPILGRNQFYRILDCIAGLVCLLDDCKTKHNLLLWNPLTKKVLILPNPTIESDLVESSCFGFGFDPLNCEYKIVRITYVGADSLTEVFRVKTESWVRIDVSYIGCGSIPSIVYQQAYVNGHVNWISSNHIILAFEVGSEVFKELVLPKALDKVDVQGLSIAVWKGFLSVFAIENSKVCLWLMSEYAVEESWTTKFVIEPYAIYRQIRGIRTNGHIIFEDLYSNLISVDPQTQLIEHLALGVQGTLSAFHMKSYSRSLALLDLG